MARVHSRDLTILSLAAQSLLTDTISIGPKVSNKPVDTTTLGMSWVESMAGLNGGDDFDHDLFYDNTAVTGTWAFLTGKFLAGVAVALIIGDGVRTITGNVLVTSVDLPIKVGDMITFKANYKWSGAVVFS